MTGVALASAFRLRPLAALASPREVIRQFTPNWFAATMGTGILSLTLAQVPGAPAWTRGLAEGLWGLNIGLFGLFAALYAARWVMFPGEARRIFGHALMSMYFGCIPMGLATIVNGLLLFGAPRWGQAAVEGAQLLWRVDAGLSVACGLAVPFLMFTRQGHSLEKMTAVWLLPIVACEVAAVTAGLLAPRLADPADRLQTLVAGYALWALSVPMALGVLAILFLRMVAHSLPPVAMAASNWLALGPIGTGALGLLVLGGASPILAGAGLADVAGAARGVDLIGGLLLWAYGLWWMAMAVMTTLRYLKGGLPFNLGWWAYTFPLGVFAAATLRLAALLPIPALTGFAQLLVAALAAIWVLVAGRTLAGAWRGELFSAPCLAEDGVAR
ncbi:TDT family transporter [Caulobacter sp. KR2-114]|uniref:TDT family transporter n=1 Tax=Caulobacter sp. KR2-114 TaxID=3400912 RepID=UPI003C0107A4